MTQTNDISIFLKNVEYIRKKNKLTVESMAAIMGISARAYQRAQSGDLPRSLRVSAVWELSFRLCIPPAQWFRPLGE